MCKYPFTFMLHRKLHPGSTTYSKSIIFLLATAIFIMRLHGTSSAQTSIDSSFANGHYMDRINFFSSLPSKPSPIIFLGNSITEAGDWTDVLPGLPVANRGISGDISFGVLARYKDLLETSPEKIFLLIGVNDLKREIPIPLILKNYEKIIRLTLSDKNTTKLYIQSVLPINKELIPASFSKVTNENIKTLNHQLKKLTASYPEVSYIDLWPVFEDETKNLKKNLTSDGIHLKPIAYYHWAQFLKENGLLTN
ncbi:GDSL-type esterase/lipase family protein [Echinicola shivajiensis]|uniref:GDSL-type esterase/lipase family protein n=1 Tax=Echinicola shivajiensis TaxID=1035916 RepID=UPI001BFCB213|nr:GDSL-type esterase/lipase family protein [Echinicola shivajiensis]